MNKEKVDSNIEEFRDCLNIGEEGSMGDAVIIPSTKNAMNEYNSGLLNKYNSFSNFSYFEFNSELVDAIANFVTTSIEKDMNEKFHMSLNILEKNGLITTEKFEMHKRSVTKAKTAASLGVYTAFSLAPLVYQGISTHIKKKDMLNFIVGSYAYINQKLTPDIIFDIKNFLAEVGITVTEQKIGEVFGKYLYNSAINAIPFISSKSKNRFGEDGIDILAKEIASRCDLKSDSVKERALNYVSSFLHIGYSDAENLISDAQASQNIVSDIIWFSAIDYRYLFSDFIKNISNSRQFANYNIENDPFAQLREERRNCLEKILEDTYKNRGFFQTLGKRKDILAASAKLMQYTLNPDYNIKTNINMIKREMDIMKYYGLQNY